MMSAEAARLALIEVLCPTAALAGAAAFPTLAGPRILDSRAPAMQDLDPDQDYTPIVAVHARDASVDRRGDASAFGDNAARCAFDLVIELAVRAEDENGDFADALAGTDPEARMTLSALAAQVRRTIEHDPAGALFRRAVKSIERVDIEPFAIPDLGLRWQRLTMRITCAVADDRFIDDGGMPEPAATIAAALPEGSYAKARMTALAARFTAITRTPLAMVTIAAPDGAPIASADTTET